MRTTILLVTLVLTGALTLSAKSGNPSGNQQGSTASSSGTDTLTGCLKGSKHQYYVVAADGSRHTVMARGNLDLSTLVNHKVTLTGKEDTTRAAGSDAEGHRKGYFAADNATDQGACKK
jgi:hypothetical protein